VPSQGDPAAAAPPPGLTPVAAAAVVAAVRRAGGDNPLLGIGLDAYAGTPADRLCGRAGPGTRRSPHAEASSLIDAVGSWVGTGERRVAASLVVLGYSARIVGPAVSMLLREGVLLDLRPSNVRYGFDPERGFTVDLALPAGWRTDAGPDLGSAALRGAWGRIVLDAHLGPLIDAVRSVVPVSAMLLWGNVASGLAGALRAIARSGAVSPDRCHADGLALLDGPLRGSGRLTLHSGRLSFVRTSCCLYYRLEGGGMCGDCVLLHRAERTGRHR
jgi:ferric iron reductase protein FhuF